MDSDSLKTPLVRIIMNLQLKIAECKKCCGCSAVSGARDQCRTSNGFLTFFFCRANSSRGSAEKKCRGLTFFSKLEMLLWSTRRSKFLRNRAVAHTPLTFFLSIFVIFTKRACAPSAVKNFMFTKKHRNR